MWGDGPLHAAGTLSRNTLNALFVRLPSFIVSADTPRSAEPPRGFSLVLAGGGLGRVVGTPPTPILPARTAEPRRLCLKVGLPGPQSLPVGPGHTLRWGWGVFTIEGMRPWPPNRRRVSVALESWTF